MTEGKETVPPPEWGSHVRCSLSCLCSPLKFLGTLFSMLHCLKVTLAPLEIKRPVTLLTCTASSKC